MRRNFEDYKEEPKMLHPNTSHYLVSKELKQLKKASDLIVDIVSV